MASLTEIAVTLPPHSYSRTELLSAAKTWLNDSTDASSLFERLLGAAEIDRRHFALPLERILALGGQAERSKVFQEEGGALAVEAVRQVLVKSGLAPSDVDTLIFTSCTAPIIPSLDARIINTLELSPQTRRIPIYQHGCAGGAVGLALAEQYAQNGERVLVCSAELCSLVFQAEDVSGGNLVGSAIFGDGAACALIEPGEKRLVYIDSVSLLLPETVQLMGYDIHDNGAHLRLDRELPSAVARAARTAIPRFLEKNGVRSAEVAWWLFHPGGAKILEIFDEMFSLSREQSRFSWEVLGRYGNMSSASILFVLEEFMRADCAAAGDYALVLGIGPGITIQLLLLQAA